MSDNTRKIKVSQAGSGKPRVVSLPELTVDMRAGLLEVGIKAGLEVMAAMFASDVEAICGSRYEHRRLREASRWGVAGGEVVLGGKKLRVRRPRVRSLSGKELRLSSYEHFRGEDPLVERVLKQILLGVSTRRYHRSLESGHLGLKMHGVSSSAVSRRFVAATAERVAEWMGRSLEGLELVALFLDGIGLGEHTVVAAIGIDTEGRKHALGIWEGATENAAVCQGLIDDLVSRGLRVDKAILVVIDGSRALRKVVKQSFGANAVIQRCQKHKERNVRSHLPKGLQGVVGSQMRRAYHSEDVNKARGILKGLITRLRDTHPGAASSLEEGLGETLTVIALKVPSQLRRSLGTTNVIESGMSIVRHVSRNVKRWRDGKMAVRWVAAGFIEAEKRFRCINGYKWIPQLVEAMKEWRDIDKEDAA
jgi:transposase-like protein